MSSGTDRQIGRRVKLVYGVCVALALYCSALVARLPGGEAPKEDNGFFFPIPGAKDCAFDEGHQRLYVTTPGKLIVIDTKQHKIAESIDLLGTLQACDISPDSKFLAVAPSKAQFIYWINTDWKKLEDMEIDQVKFKANASESGVHGLCVGFDNSVLFSTTFAGSGGVKLRQFDPKDKSVVEVANVNMDSVISPSGDRHFAAVAEGNISSGPLSCFDFQTKKLKPIASLNTFNYEIACAHDAKYFAAPNRKGCDLYDAGGSKLGTLEGAPVICAVFHPKADTLFVMRNGEVNIQEYELNGKKVANGYPLDKPLVITGEVSDRVVANVRPVGRDVVMATFRRVMNVNYKTFQSGRLRISDSGDKLFAVIPTGVYTFTIEPHQATAPAANKGPKIRVIE